MKPAQRIAQLVEARATKTDDEVLAELEAFEPLGDLPDWDRAYLFVALSDVAAMRRLRSAAPLLLERAAFEDHGELMRGLCHALEAIFNPDWAALTDVCIAASSSSRAGTRLWAVDALRRLRDPRSAPALRARLDDVNATIREEARVALDRL